MSIRIWFLIQQFVTRHNLPEHNHIPFVNYLRCHWCRTRVALIQDYIPTVNDLVFAGFFTRVFDVEVAQGEQYHRVIDGMTLVETYCIECRNLLGWELIAVSQPSRSHRVGGFYMRLHKIICWNNVTFLDTLLRSNNVQAPNNQDGGADEEQDHDQNVGANEQNVDQDGDINEQDLGENEENADQDEHANEQDLGANEQNTDQDENGDINEQVPDEQEVDANEQNADEEGGANEQDGGVNEQVPSQDVDIAEGMGNIDLNANI
ncbi:uncharacterized protein LOC129898571 [Solanum dulcamara]|uniref:uncharacterized protein LOC129898571 n=1 Tax=Solanum dulcamara TaxID=45834 RepID=UPI00248592A4|nr:uncharacterized protein LOC129898571 [Solanum dulcamara]XP_055829131.1 uncharacterized protein LOC129898571 [Solanum dulcamara]XP_055829132.1 uncharacterized protein LOC129898571 [Solanum dulcamara]